MSVNVGTQTAIGAGFGALVLGFNQGKVNGELATMGAVGGGGAVLVSRYVTDATGSGGLGTLSGVATGSAAALGVAALRGHVGSMNRTQLLATAALGGIVGLLGSGIQFLSAPARH